LEAYSLFEVNQYIKRVLALNFEEPIWVECEINQVSNSRGNLYLDLIEKSEDNDQIVAKSAATLWYRQFLFIKKKLDKLTDSILAEGVKVKLKVNIEFSERYGMSLNIIDIDPAFTFGQFELNRQKVIEQLRSKGLLDRNGQHKLPTVIKRIAVISSETAAGYQDFVNQILENAYDYHFDIDLFPAAMQGQKTEREVVDALRSTQEGNYHIIAIIRGGGSKLDLAAFDNYNIAYEIANCDIPVFTGIGHDIDQTVCDIVSNQVLKTPSAVANFILDHNTRFESEIDYLLQLISQKTANILDDKKSELVRFEEQLKSSPSLILNSKKLNLEKLESDIFSKITDTLKSKAQSITNIEKIIEVLEPKNVMKRGFSLVKQNGKYISRKDKLKKDKSNISIEFYDGSVDL